MKDNALLVFAITGGAATLFSLFICALGLWWSGAFGG